jgi:hypothetical protein
MSGLQVLLMLYGVTYVTGGLEPLVFLLSAASVWPAGTVLDLRCVICDGGAGTPGLPLYLPPVSCLQVLLLIYGVTYVTGLLGHLPLHLPPMSSLQVLFLIYSVTYVRGLLGSLVFLFIYRQCLACRYCI